MEKVNDDGDDDNPVQCSHDDDVGDDDNGGDNAVQC